MDTFTFNIPKDLKLAFNIAALKIGRNMADITRELIEKFVEEFQTQK